MMSYKFAFVILHYLTIDDTIECVESIKKYCNNLDYDIIIVDNCSSNQSGEKLKKLFKGDKNITVIINEENLGFARGNNIGFMFAKEKLNSDFIVLLNNDTLLLNECFGQKIIEEYEKTKFAVLGPKIILKDGSINPINSNIPTLEQLKKELKKLKIEYNFNKSITLKLIYDLFINLKKKLKKVLVKMKIKTDNVKELNPNERYENIVLHGCFWIFSKQYIRRFDGLNDETFLYREEELLAVRLRNNHLLSVYNPELMIKHNEDSATNAINKKRREKILFMNKYKIQSTNILIKHI